MQSIIIIIVILFIFMKLNCEEYFSNSEKKYPSSCFSCEKQNKKSTENKKDKLIHRTKCFSCSNNNKIIFRNKSFIRS